VVGYLRPVKQWNDGKLSEYRRRKTFKVDESAGQIGLPTAETTGAGAQGSSGNASSAKGTALRRPPLSTVA
jgi:ribonucleoside-triphosphate reductase